MLTSAVFFCVTHSPIYIHS